jgi:PHD/YefM family antitoxin component YafN of YafNO toxin-antitoxin module
MGTTKERYVTGRNGRKKAIILSIRRYEQLMEDLHDLAIVAERRKEKTISFEEMKRRLKADGVL